MAEVDAEVLGKPLIQSEPEQVRWMGGEPAGGEGGRKGRKEGVGGGGQDYCMRMCLSILPSWTPMRRPSCVKQTGQDDDSGN